jgi:hypothetical protein
MRGEEIVLKVLTPSRALLSFHLRESDSVVANSLFLAVTLAN